MQRQGPEFLGRRGRARPLTWRRRYSRGRSSPAAAAFAYANLGYVMAGLVIDRVTGTSWKDVLAASIFAPLGMRRTTASMSAALGWGVAVPY